MEHKKSKKRYARTSRKSGFEGQIANIERRQKRIARIKQAYMQHREKMLERLNIVHDPIANNLDSEYSVGKAQNQPHNIYAFLQKHTGDPAIVVGYYSESEF